MNNTTIFKPYFLPHVSYVTGKKEFSCNMIRNIDWEVACDFVLNTETCRRRSGIDYMQLMFCEVPTSTSSFILIGLVLGFIMFISYMFLTSAAAFYCVHNSIAIAHLIGLNEDNTGTVVFAALNAITDFIDILLDTDPSAIDITVNYKYGNAVICTSLYAGLLIILNPFNICFHYFLRNTIFILIIATYIGWNIAMNEDITSIPATTLISLWFGFIVFMFIEEYFVQRSYLGRNELPEHHKRFHIKFPVSTESSVPNATHANQNIFSQFFKDINPIKRNDFKNGDIWTKIFLIIGFPQRFILNIFIPVVDYSKPNHGWSKLLNCLNIIMTFIIALLLRVNSIEMQHFYTSLSIGLLIVVFVLLTSRTDRPPHYHTFFAFFGILSSAIISKLIINELYGIWYMIANVNGLSRKSIGIFVHKWIMTVTGLVVNFVIAELGYPVVAFQAFYGSLTLHYTILFGIYCLYISFTNTQSVLAVRSDIAETCLIFLGIICSTTIISVIISYFEMKKCIGYYLIIIYFIFMLFVTLSELEIIHPYGTNHISDFGPETNW